MPDIIRDLRVDHLGKHRIEIRSILEAAVEWQMRQDDFCTLCDCHPSSGHAIDCPLVKDAIGLGGALVPEPDEKETA